MPRPMERIISEKGGATFEGIKLLLCENPLPPIREAAEAAKEEVHRSNFYTEPYSAPLRKALSDHLGISKSNIHINAGSELILRQLFERFGQRVHLLTPTYALFPEIARSYSESRLVPESNFQFDLTQLKIPPGTTLVVIVNPNNPNGGIFDMGPLPDLLRRHPETLFIVDEAFIDLGGTSVARQVPQHQNLIVTRTFSKAHSLAGFRVGYAVLPDPMAHDLNTSNDAYPLTRPGQAAALANLKHYDRIKERAEQLKGWTKELIVRLEEAGLKCYPTDTYFFLADVSPMTGEAFARRLKDQNILVKAIEDPALPPNFVRMTTSTEENNHTVVRAIGEIMKGQNKP